MSIVNPASALSSVITWAVARRVIYAVFVLAVLASGAAHVGFDSVAVADPSWLTVASAVLLYLGIPVGSLALVNVTPNARVQVLEADFAGTDYGRGAEA